MRIRYRILIPAILLLTFTARHLPAQEIPQIEDVQPFLRNDSLFCDFSVPQLFAPVVLKTLYSGLPVLVEVKGRLLTGAQQIITVPAANFRLSYDIWEDRYSEENARLISFFPSIEALQERWNPHRDFPMLPPARLRNLGRFQIQLDLKVILLAHDQGEKLKEWILGSHETEENMPSMDRDTGFKFDLNRIISIFLKRDDIIGQFESQATTEALKGTDLPVRQASARDGR